MNKFTVPEVEENVKKGNNGSVKTDIIGAVNYAIGTGRHAQDSVVWLTIKWSLCLGIFLSFILIVYMWPSSPEGVHPPIKAVFPMAELKSIWGIFVPIVTLALGYMFGKGR